MVRAQPAAACEVHPLTCHPTNSPLRTVLSVRKVLKESAQSIIIAARARMNIPNTDKVAKVVTWIRNAKADLRKEMHGLHDLLLVPSQVTRIVRCLCLLLCMNPN